MKHRDLILKKIHFLKEELREITRLISFNNDQYQIIAGYTRDSVMTGLVDKNGKFFPSQPTSFKSKEFEDLDEEYKFRVLCKGIYQAIKNIPVTELEPYLKDDGPQIELKILNDIFNTKNYPESCKELAETMELHFSNYRIKVVSLEPTEWSDLLEE